MSKRLVLRANAKINLTLNILGKRSDGYHDIDSVMQSISLHDVIALVPAKGYVSVKCDHPDVPEGPVNLAYKAAAMFLEAVGAKGEGIDIAIKKNIPVAAGLGGGSADAAAVLFGMNILHGSKLHREKINDIAQKIGSDVAFCLTGGTARCTGRGEIVNKTNPEGGNAFLLAMPDLNVATKTVYEEYDRLKADGHSTNDLEKATYSKYKDVKILRDRLVEATGIEWMMSGSGPVHYAEFRDLAEIESVLGKVAGICKYHVAVRMNEGVSIIGQEGLQ